MLVTGVTAPACAAQGPYSVWIDAVPDSGTAETLAVPVKTDGTAMDGLVVLTYDPEVLEVSAEEVDPAGVDMYSANVTEDGTLKISRIAGDAPKAGTLL